jgi:tetratricopeptide (TPR) repeat protein
LLGVCYEELEAYDLAVAAYRKSIEIGPKSGKAYQYLGIALAKQKDEKGAMAAFQEAFRIRPDDLRCIRSHAMGLVLLGRPAEGFQMIVDAIARFPSRADDPWLCLRAAAASAAINCADGKGSAPLSVAQRLSYRKKAFELLAANLTDLAKLAGTEPDLVHVNLRRWLVDRNFESVRPPRTTDLPPEERKGWEELWARVKSLTHSPALPKASNDPAR